MPRRSQAKQMCLLTVAASILFSSSLHAGQNQAILEVSASTIGSCVIASVTNLMFSTYRALDNIDIEGENSVTVRCNEGTIPSAIELDNGTHPLGSQRRLQFSQADFLNYAFFQDADRSIPWGIGATAFHPTSSPNFDVGTTYTIYARIPKGQFAATGQYQDTVKVTVIF
jgi:spore coat protein U-like protein